MGLKCIETPYISNHIGPVYIETPYMSSYMGPTCIETPYISSHMDPVYIETPYTSHHMGPMFIFMDIFISYKSCLATLKNCDTMKQSVCEWQYIYSPTLVGLSSLAREVNGCYKRKARLFKWIELSVAGKGMYVNKTNMIQKRLNFLRLRWFYRGWVVESWIGIENLACLATLKRCDTTKQSVCRWQCAITKRGTSPL